MFACAYQKLNPTILMMKSAEDRPSNELAKPLDRPTAWRILVQRQVRSAFVVIAGVGRSDPAQMALAEGNRVIKGTPCGSSRSVFPHTRSAKVTAGPLGDLGYPSPLDAS